MTSAMLMVNQLAGFGAGGTTMPEFVAAGAGAASGGAVGSVAVPYPAGIVAGYLLILHMIARDSSDGSVTTPSGWTQINTGNLNLSQDDSYVYFKIATGSESGNLTVTTAGDVQEAGRMYLFKYNQGSGTPYENAAVNTTGSGTTLSQLSIAASGENRLLLHLTFILNNTTVTAFTGETGGDFTEAVAEYSATGATLQLQIASMPTAGTVSGGSATIGAASSRIRHVLSVLPL